VSDRDSLSFGSRQQAWVLTNGGLRSRRRSRLRLRVWMLVHAALLGVVVYGVVAVVTPGVPAPPIIAGLRRWSSTS
jgi:hypothetical protein